MDIATDFFSWLMPQIDRIWEEPAFQVEISERLHSIHEDLTWEVGPDIVKPQFFAISPNCDPQLLAITVALIRMAPEHAEWAFYAAKPPKLWTSRQFEAQVGEDRIRVVFDDWTYVLTASANGNSGDVTFFPSSADDDLEVGLLQGFAELFVLFEVGELAYIERIDKISVERRDEAETPVEYFSQEVEALD